MNKFLPAFILLLSTFQVKAQQQERTVFLYNTLFGGVTAGVGATINKEKSENWKHAFLRGFWQGSIGGGLSYSGKKMIYLVNSHQNPVYGWPARILYSAGTSIIENAGLNEPFLQNWSIEYGPARFDFSVNGKKDFRVRFLPFTIYSVIAASRNSVFELGTSLKSGDLVFRHKADFIRFGDGLYAGMNYGRAFTYTPNPGKYFIFAHEMIHSFQYREYQVLNTWLKPLAAKVKPSKTKQFLSKTVYPDLPYMWGLYYLEGYHSYVNYFRNFFEFEAERFATNSYVPVR